MISIDRLPRPASRGSAGALLCAAVRLICSKVDPSRNGSSSSNFRMRTPRALVPLRGIPERAENPAIRLTRPRILGRGSLNFLVDPAIGQQMGREAGRNQCRDQYLDMPAVLGLDNDIELSALYRGIVKQALVMDFDDVSGMLTDHRGEAGKRAR